MKVIGIVGSPRKTGNAELLTKHTLEAVSGEGLDTELIHLAGLETEPCTACMACKEQEIRPIEDDLFPIYLRMKEADGAILASPVYYGSATSLVKALMERVRYISRWNGEPFQRKVGGPLVAARRSGKNFTIAQLTFWFQILGFFAPGSTYWNVSIGRKKRGSEAGRRRT
jgi:multimeric flavodoxin WrbA